MKIIQAFAFVVLVALLCGVRSQHALPKQVSLHCFVVETKEDQKLMGAFDTMPFLGKTKCEL